MNIPSILRQKTHVVGTITCPEDIEVARLHPAWYDLLEWRIDKCFGNSVASEIGELRDSGTMIILTFRDHAEGGGQPSYGPDQRAAMYRTFCRFGCLFDIEVANCGKMADTIADLTRCGLVHIASVHKFDGALTEEEIRAAAKTAAGVGAHVLKLVGAPTTYAACSEMFEAAARIGRGYGPMMVAPMAVGAFASQSRIRAIVEKAPLVYGWLAKPAAPGQPSAHELMEYVNPPVAVAI